MELSGVNAQQHCFFLHCHRNRVLISLSSARSPRAADASQRPRPPLTRERSPINRRFILHCAGWNRSFFEKKEPKKLSDSCATPYAPQSSFFEPCFFVGTFQCGAHKGNAIISAPIEKARQKQNIREPGVPGRLKRCASISESFSGSLCEQREQFTPRDTYNKIVCIFSACRQISRRLRGGLGDWAAAHAETRLYYRTAGAPQVDRVLADYLLILKNWLKS